ncbi:AI-2E family transporter [Candidatus Dojkabacteria bacterium]|nr:AI-2E family transporter [Candidatus Dojkabacteria bacterium]
MDEKQVIKIEISKDTIVRVMLVCVLGLGIWYTLSRVWDVFIILFLSYILSVALRPTIKALSKNNRSKAVSIIVVHAVFSLLLVLVTGFIIVPIVNELPNLFQNLESSLENIVTNYGFIADFIKLWGIDPSSIDIGNSLRETFKGFLSMDLLQQGIGFANNVIGVAVAVLTIFIISPSLSFMYDDMMIGILNLIADIKKRKNIHNLIETINEKMGYWLQGQLILCVIIFVFSWIILSLLSVPLALPLALLAGLLEVIPNLGPLISAIIPVVIAIAGGNIYQAIGVIVGFVILQQIENYFIVPKVMSKSVSLPSLAILLTVLVGGKLMGPLGAFISIPVAAIVKIIIDYSISEREKKIRN